MSHDVSGDGFKSEIQTEGTFSHTFDDAGDYPYVCTLHAGMRGTLTVVDAIRILARQYESYPPARSRPRRIPSLRACQEASMMFWWTPTVPQLDSPLVVSIKTRTRAAVPSEESRSRTL